MRLNDPLITNFKYNNKEYEIDLTYDNVLDVFDVLDDVSLRGYEKAEINLSLLIGESVEGTEAIEMWNYIYKNFINVEKKQPIQYDRNGDPMPVQTEDDDTEDYMDLEQDAEYIYASFKQAYNMNLIEQQGKLHWHEFQALLAGLPSDTIMQKIIQIRTWKPSKGESAKHKETMRELQKIYALNVE